MQLSPEEGAWARCGAARLPWGLGLLLALGLVLGVGPALAQDAVEAPPAAGTAEEPDAPEDAGSEDAGSEGAGSEGAGSEHAGSDDELDDAGAAPPAMPLDGRLRAATDVLVYSDDNAVRVVSPQLSVRYALDEDGGEISARAVVDVISAASVDVVTHATNGFDEVRYEAELAASKAFGDHTPSLAYRASREPDYVSHGVSVGLTSRLGTPDSVLALGWGGTFDRVGRSGTPRDAFEEHLQTHTASLAYTQTLSPRLLLRGAYNLVYQRGYMEKPYRYVPLFTEAQAAAAEASGGLDLDSFDAFRSNVRPPEEVPDTRVRHAAALRALAYFPDTRTSLRLDYRFYADDWDVRAHTLEPVVRSAIREHWELAGWLRAYRQSGASFWQRAYVVPDLGTLPHYRSVDRDLSPYTTLTFGLRTTWRNERWAVYLDAAVAQTWYDDFLYLDTLTALLAQAGVRITL